jgi:hypothetical protein
MSTWILSRCTVADAAALASNNIPAFWVNPHWIIEWRHRTLEYHISQVAKRYPRTLLNDRDTKRHQKAINPETRCVVGYARWSIPPSHATNVDGTLAWSEAVVPAVAPKEEDEIRRIADTAHWDPNCDFDDLINQVRDIKDEILGKKPFISA